MRFGQSIWNTHTQWSVKNHTTSKLALPLELKASFQSNNFIVVKGNSALETQDSIRAVASGGAGRALAPPQVLAEQLTLSQPGGQISPTTVLRAPQIFRPCDGPGMYLEHFVFRVQRCRDDGRS